MLRIVAKNLILWDQIEPTEAWLERHTATQTSCVVALQRKCFLLLPLAEYSNFCYEATAKQLLIARLLAFRDAKRSDAHPALMASRPAPDDLDVITLETCQSTVAMALGMVMAGTGDLDALRTLRSLRKKTSLDTGYGVHMATHMAIGWAFRHLYALAARHHCIEAVEVDSKQPAHVHVTLETETGTDLETETLRFPRPSANVHFFQQQSKGVPFFSGCSWLAKRPHMVLPMICLEWLSFQVRSISINSEGFWPVTIQRAESGTPAARWMKALKEPVFVVGLHAPCKNAEAVDETRRLYVKRCGPERPDSRLESQAWFPTFTAPDANHVERLTMAKLAFGAPGEGWVPNDSTEVTK
eukprot:g11564.t1